MRKLIAVQVDYKRFAETFEFKNPASAKASWNGLKKKLGKMAGGSVGTLIFSPFMRIDVC